MNRRCSSPLGHRRLRLRSRSSFPMHPPPVRIEQVATLEQLEEVSDGGPGGTCCWVAAGTGVIVPGRVLDRFAAGAVNFNDASPAYPGRDPHHFAALRPCRRYGATAHIMTERVDEGPLLDVEGGVCRIRRRTRDLSCGGPAVPDAAGRAGRPRLIACVVQPNPELAWRGNKNSRNDFIPCAESTRFPTKTRLPGACGRWRCTDMPTPTWTLAATGSASKDGTSARAQFQALRRGFHRGPLPGAFGPCGRPVPVHRIR